MSRAIAARPDQAALRDDPGLTGVERAALARMAAFTHPQLKPSLRGPLGRLLSPVNAITQGWDDPKRLIAARNLVLMEVHRRQAAYWAWDEATWCELATSPEPAARMARFYVVALGYLIGGHHRLHHRAGIMQIARLADLVFGCGTIQPALDQVRSALLSWKASEHSMSWQITNATIDLLLSCGSPRLEDITYECLLAVAADHHPGRSARRQGLFKVSRVLADKGIIPAPLSSNRHNRGPQPQTLASVPGPWLEWAQRRRTLSTHEPATIRTMFSTILMAGRWASDKHPDALTPDTWTRDIAAEYIADTMQAVVGQWGGHNRNRSRWGSR